MRGDGINGYTSDARQRGLTRDEVVEVVLSPKRELADEGEPGQQPGRELLGEDRPVEWLPFGATPVRACLVGQANGISGVGHGASVIVGSTLGGIAGLEVEQALCEIGGGDGKKEESKQSERFDSAGSCHDLYTGKLVGVTKGGDFEGSRSTRLLYYTRWWRTALFVSGSRRPLTRLRVRLSTMRLNAAGPET